MKNILFAISLSTLSLFALSSCDYSRTSGGLPPVAPQSGSTDSTDPGDSTTDPSDSTNPSQEPAVRFADVKSTVFDNSCAGCHQNIGLDLSFSDYANTKSFAEKILNRVFVRRNMPLGGKLTELEEQALRAWLDAGAPE